MNNPKVSVIIPVYNTEQYLRECLDSIVNQTLRELEIICINDGATDGCPAILSEYALQDDRILVHTQENKGLAATRNVGISIASGKYIYFFDSDDLLKPEALSELYNLAERKNTDVIYFDSEVLFESEKAYQNRRHITESYYIRTHDYSEVINGPQLFAEMMKNDEYRCCIPMQFIRNKHLEKNQIRFYDGILHEDDLFSFLCIMQAERAAHIGKPFYERRVREGSIVTNNPGFRNFHGYLTDHINIQSFISKISYPDDIDFQIKRYLEAIQNNMKSNYSSADDAHTWEGKLNAKERRYARRILGDSSNAQADPLVCDTKEILSRYGAKRVMWQILKERFYPLAKQFFKFGIVGLSSTLIHLGVYYLLVFLGVHYIAANVVAFVVSVCNAYFWNSRYVFAGKAGDGQGGDTAAQKKGEVRQFAKVFIVYMSTFLLGTGLLYIMVDILRISEWLAPLINLCVTVPLNFLLNKFWAFR